MSATLQQFLNIFLAYRKDGFLKGSELIFTKEAALSLIDDVAQLNIVCLGAGGWYSSEPHPERLGEDLEADYSVPNQVLNGSDAVQHSAELTKTFIKYGMKARDIFVGVSFGHPEEWWKVIKQAWEMTEGPTSALHLPPLNGLTTDEAT